MIEEQTRDIAMDIIVSLNDLACDDAPELSAVVSGGDENGGGEVANDTFASWRTEVYGKQGQIKRPHRHQYHSFNFYPL